MRAALATLGVLLTCTVGSAQERPTQGPVSEPPAAQTPVVTGVPEALPSGSGSAAPTGLLVSEQREGELLASDLVGRPLYGPSGQRIGEITDVLIDRARRLSAVIATLDQTPTKVGIPFEALNQAPVGRRDVRLTIKVDPAALRAAKSFEPLAKEAAMDDNQDLTGGSGAATGASVPPGAR